MKKIKEIKKKISVFFNRYINGTRGAISILMAIIMSPLLSVSLLLVESVRYQNAIEALTEITGCSSFSVLADYDSYIDERFGLLAISQESDINDVFAQYMNENINLLGDSVTLNRCAARGCYSFTNPDVLKQQLLEYSEISVATEVLVEGINLEDLLDELKEKLGLDEVEDQMTAVSSTIDISASVEKFIEGLGKVILGYDDYKTAKEEYDAAYTEFCSKADAYILAIQTAEQEHAAAETEGEETEEFNVYEDADVVAAWNALSTAKNDFKDAVDEMYNQLDSMRENVNAMWEATSKLGEEARELQDSLGEDDVTVQWIMGIVEQVTAIIGTEVSEDIDDQVNPELEALQSLSTKISNLSKTTISSSWTSEKVRTDYAKVSLTTITQGMIDSLVGLDNTLNESGAVSTTAGADISALMEVANDLLGISGVYNTALNSNVGSSYIYASQTMSFTSNAMITSITSLISECENFSEEIENLNKIELLKAVGELLVAVASFVLSIITWIAETLVNLVVFIASGPTEWYNSLLLYGYGIYNCPNRTTFKDGESISGYEYKDIFVMAGGQNNGTLSGTLEDLGELNDSTGGSDQMFKGAEGEYLLVGSKSEIMNQSATFLNIFLFRLALNLYPVLKSHEVATMSAAAGPAAWAITIAIVLIEPLIDTIILVNSGDVSLFKGTANNPLYCTPSGIPSLITDATGIAGLGDGLTDRLNDVIESNLGAPSSGGFKVSYSEHLLLLMVLSVDQTTYLQRMQNLIQMETACNYKNDYAFSLSKTYTYVESDITYTLNPMFSIDALTENGAFTKTKVQYTGY